MMMFVRKAAVAAILGGSAMAAPNVYAYGCPPFNTGMVVGQTMAVEAALKALWQSMINNLAKMMIGYDRQELGAMKVLTAQISTAAKAEMKAMETLSQGRMTALAYLESIKEQARVFRQYSPQTGQGVDPCQQLSAQQLMRLAAAAGAQMAREWAKQMPSAPGRFGDAATYYKERMERRQALYATPNEEKLGQGKAQKDVVTLATGEKFALAGADTNASVLFADSADPRIIQAKKDFITNMAGPPDAPLPKTHSNSPAAKEYLLAKARKDAVMSAAVTSLTAIAAENTPTGMGGKSKNHAFREIRDLYYGGNAALRWAEWALQDVRGLRMDQMRIDSATMAAKEEQYKSTQRLEVLLGVLLMQKSSQMSGPLNAHAASLADNKLRSPVN